MHTSALLDYEKFLKTSEYSDISVTDNGDDAGGDRHRDHYYRKLFDLNRIKKYISKAALLREPVFIKSHISQVFDP